MWTTQALAQTPLYLLDSDFSSPTFIFSVDKISGQIAEVGQVPNPTGEVLALAAANANLLYSSTAEGQDQDIAAISAITVSPFLVIPIGNVAGKLIGMAFSSEGDLYAIDELTEELSLIQLAPTLGQTVIGQVHLGSPSGPVLNLDGADIVEDGNGVWYLWTNITQDLFLLDVTTAVASQLDPVNSGLGRLSGLAFDYQAGELFGSSGPLEALLTLDPSTGVILDAVNFCTTCPTTVYNHRLGDMASPHCADDDDDDSSPEGGACGAIDCNDANGAIHPNAAEVCNNADDNCDGMVDEEPAASVSCSDSNACNGVETCTAGTCTGGPPPNCNDGNVCTDDLCIPVSGCSNPFNTAPCSDQNACTTIDQCAAGECVGNTPPNCSDGNVCTDDSCNPGIGCVTTNNTAPCDDGAYCTVNDTCAAGACAPGTPRDCTASGGQCNNGICNETIDQCVAQPKPDATPCSDGNQCTLDDACVSGICQGDAMTCGDGVLQASCGEECDDGDLDPGDGCSPTCTLEPCGPAPIADCRRPIVAEKSLIALKNGAPDSKDRLHWLWVKGAVTPKADFGDPRVATSYQLCIYDSTPTLLLSANAPAASTCNPSKPKPCWQQTRKGFKYMDKELTPGGLYKIILAEGLEPRRAKITVSGKGALLGVNGVPMPIGDLPLTIQLKSSDGVCWETTHPTAKKNTPVQFRARSD